MTYYPFEYGHAIFTGVTFLKTLRNVLYNDNAFVQIDDNWQLNIDWVNRQLQYVTRQPSLIEALAHMASEFSLSYIRTELSWMEYQRFMTAFLNQVRQVWIDAEKPLTEFQPNFIPNNQSTCTA